MMVKFVASLMLPLLVCGLTAATQISKIDEQQLFIRRLIQVNLPRMALQVWEEVNGQAEQLNDQQQFIHRSQELNFLIGTLKIANNSDEMKRRWKRCQRIIQDLRLLNNNDLSLSIDYALLRFALLEFAYEQQLHEGLYQQLSQLVKNIRKLYERQGDRKKSVPVGAGRSFYLEQVRQSDRLRYSLAWSQYYLAELSPAEEKMDLWEDARVQLEHFLDRPVYSVLFVRALIAVCRIDEQLGDRIEAMYLLDDVESEIEKLPISLAAKIWNEHLRLVKSYKERMDLALSLHTYVISYAESSKEWQLLRYQLLGLCMDLLKDAQPYRSEPLWSGMAQEHIDALFEEGSEYAEFCFPYIIKLAHMQEMSQGFEVLAEAEKAYADKNFALALTGYKKALKHPELRANKRLFHLLNLKLHIAQQKEGQIVESFQTLNTILPQLEDERLADAALRLWLSQTNVLMIDNVKVVSENYRSFFKLYNNHANKSLHRLLYRSYLVSLEQQHWFFADAAGDVLKSILAFQDEAALLSAYQRCCRSEDDDEQKWVDNIKSFKQQLKDIDQQALEFLVFRYLGIKAESDQLLMQQAALVRYVRQEQLIAADRLRILDYYLLEKYAEHKTLQFHEQLVKRIKSTDVANDWELERYVNTARYFQHLSQQRTGKQFVEDAIYFFDKSLVYMRPRFDDASLHSLRYNYARLLVEENRVQGALSLIAEFPKNAQQTWEVQLLYNQCLIKQKNYEQALHNWRTLVKSLPEGKEDWLLAKWYIAQCLHKLKDSDKALKLIDYVLLLYENMPAHMRERYKSLRSELRN